MNRNNTKFYDNLYPVYTTADGQVTFEAVRLRGKNHMEEVRLYMKQKGEPIKQVLQTPLSNLSSSLNQVTNYGVSVSHSDLAVLLREVNHSYEKFPVIDEVTGLGWQYDDEGKVRSFAGSEFIDCNGNFIISDPEAGLPTAEGTDDVNLINDFMKEQPVRQIVMVYNLAAPIAGLVQRCFILSLSGKSSTGKTLIAKLAQSQSCSTAYPRLSRTLNGTDNAMEKNLEGIRGMCVLLDDASLTDKRFNWTQNIYRLGTGTVKERMDRENRVSKTENFHTTFIITTESPILSRVDATKEGVNGRMIEIAVRDGVLFDDEAQCSRMEQYASENYGNALPKLVGVISKLGVEKVKDMVKDEKRSLEAKLGEEELVVKRHCWELAVIRTTARLANECLGYSFDIEAMTDFIIENIRVSLEDTREMQPDDQVMAKIYPRLKKKVEGYREIGGETYGLLPYSELKALVDEYCKGIKYSEAADILWEHHVLYKKGNSYSHVQTINGQSVRRMLIVVKEVA